MRYWLECWGAKYWDFDGRASRKEFWLFHLFQLLALIAVVALCLVAQEAGIPWTGLVYLGFLLASTPPGLAVTVRRLHDTSRSGWYVLLNLIPIAGLILLIIFLLDSTPGENQYGPNPKGIGNSPEPLPLEA